MRSSFLCLLALQLAFAAKVMAMPMAPAEGGEEPPAGGDEPTEAAPEGGDEATEPAPEAREEATEEAPAGGDEATEPAPEGGDEPEPTEPTAEAVKEDPQANAAMQAGNEAARNMDMDRNVAEQKLAEIGSAIDQDLQELDSRKKANSRNSWNL